MPGTELRGPSAHTRIGPQRGRLRNAAIVFEQISADVDARRDAWLVAIGVALENLADAWNEHVSFTEGPGGLFEELLDESSGEVAPEVDRLRRDHEVLVAHIVRARELLASPGAGPDDTRILLSLTGIAKQVDQHRRRGSDLLYRVYSVDVSARGLTGHLMPQSGHPNNPGTWPTIGQTVSVRVFRCFAFVDMCGFTAHERHPRRRRGAGGPGRIPRHRARALARPRHPGREVAGRRLHVRGHEVRPVVETVLDLTERMENASIVLPLRIGIAAGRVIVFEGDDFIGMSINLASRSVRRRRAGEILVNDEVAQALGDAFPVISLGERQIPGHRRPHPGLAGRRARGGGRTAAELRGMSAR